MTFDKPEHQELVKQMIQAATFPGHVLDLAAEFKRAVEVARVVSDAEESALSTIPDNG